MSKEFESPPVQNSGKRIKTDKDPLNKFSWDSAPPFLTDMLERANFLPGSNPAENKQFVEQIIRELLMTPSEQRKYMRPDPVSPGYRMNYQYLKQNVPKLNANPTGLTIEQILGIDRHFHRTYFNNNVAAQILARYNCTSYMSGKKWELKHHKLTDYGWPEFSRSFQKLGFINVGPEGVKSEGYGWGAAYEIPFTVIDMAAGGVFDPDYWTVFFLGKKMGRFGNQRIWLGGAGENTTGRGAPSLTGLVNDGSVTTLTSPSTDYGFSGGKADFEDNFEDIKRSWYQNSVWGPAANVYVTTPGLAAELWHNDSAVGDLKTLAQLLHHKWFRGSGFSSWYIDKDIVSTTVSSMTKNKQKWFAFKAGPSYVRRTVVYPLQRKLLSEKFKTYPDDIAFAYITGDILQIYDKNAIIAAGSDAKCNTTGWEMNGLVMDAQRYIPRAYQPQFE